MSLDRMPNDRYDAVVRLSSYCNKFIHFLSLLDFFIRTSRIRSVQAFGLRNESARQLCNPDREAKRK